jgi:hypothetical protein
MFDSLLPVAELLLPSGESFVKEAVIDTSVRAGNTLITPHDPSTLSLALVGIVTLVVYFAASGLRRVRRKETPATSTRFVSTDRRQSGEQPKEMPKRGAA